MAGSRVPTPGTPSRPPPYGPLPARTWLFSHWIGCLVPTAPVSQCQPQNSCTHQDEAAIATRHDIYYNTVDGTLAAAQFYNNLAAEGKVQYITLDGQGSISEVKANLLASLGKA